MESNKKHPESPAAPRLALMLSGGVLISLVLVFMPFFFPPSGKTGSDVLAGIGRFHLLILHFPAALLPMIPLLEMFKRLRPAALPILGIAALSAASASVLGILLASNDGFAGELVEKHMWSCITASILALFMFILRFLYEQTNLRVIGAGYGILLIATLGMLAFGSHQGASLVHGKEFLTEKFAPSPEPTESMAANEPAYQTIIEPIFRAHCWSCHSTAKEKGGFRMDDFERMLEGGDGGMPGIEPGNLKDSEVYYRITLDSSSKGIMPPVDEKPLTAMQIEQIRIWIQSGASRTISLGELKQQETLSE